MSILITINVILWCFWDWYSNCFLFSMMTAFTLLIYSSVIAVFHLLCTLPLNCRAGLVKVQNSSVAVFQQIVMASVAYVKLCWFLIRIHGRNYPQTQGPMCGALKYCTTHNSGLFCNFLFFDGYSTARLAARAPRVMFCRWGQHFNLRYYKDTRRSVTRVANTNLTWYVYANLTQQY